jgi:hypothetical protein
MYCTCWYCQRRSVSVEDFAVIRHFIPELPTNIISATVPLIHRLLKHIAVNRRFSVVHFSTTTNYSSVGMLRPTENIGISSAEGVPGVRRLRDPVPEEAALLEGYSGLVLTSPGRDSVTPALAWVRGVTLRYKGTL